MSRMNISAAEPKDLCLRADANKEDMSDSYIWFLQARTGNRWIQRLCDSRNHEFFHTSNTRAAVLYGQLED